MKYTTILDVLKFNFPKRSKFQSKKKHKKKKKTELNIDIEGVVKFSDGEFSDAAEIEPPAHLSPRYLRRHRQSCKEIFFSVDLVFKEELNLMLVSLF